MQQTILSGKTILSTWPQVLEAKRYHTTRNPATGRDIGGSRIYVMPAAVPENIGKFPDVLNPLAKVALDEVSRRPYSTLQIQDTYQMIRNLTADDDDPNVYTPMFIPVDMVVEDLVREWTFGRHGATDGVGPGIMQIVGESPTQPEIISAFERQGEYCSWLVQDGDLLFAQQDFKGIGQVHKLAAVWLREDRPWMRKLGQETPVQCPACREEIKLGAVLCKHCSTNIPEFLAKARK